MPVCFIRLNMPVCFIRLQMNGISVLYHHVLMCHLDTFEFWIWMPFHCFIIDLLHKSHNAPVPYPTMHHFVTEICTCVHISVAKWCIVGNLSNALWYSWDGSIVGGPGGPFTSFFAAIQIWWKLSLAIIPLLTNRVGWWARACKCRTINAIWMLFNTREKEIKFIGLLRDRGHRGPYSL